MLRDLMPREEQIAANLKARDAAVGGDRVDDVRSFSMTAPALFEKALG